MAKITEDMQEVVGKAKAWALATVSKDGIPNVIPLGAVQIISDNEILTCNNFWGKTLKNVKENPGNVAISAWDWDSAQGYQFKGRIRLEDSGKNFDDAVHLARSAAKARLTMLKAPRAKREMLERTPGIKTKSAAIITVESIYLCTPGPNAGKKVD